MSSFYKKDTGKNINLNEKDKNGACIELYYIIYYIYTN